MRELTILELDLIIGGEIMQEEISSTDSYSYGNSSVSDLYDGTGDWAGVVYEGAEGDHMQAEAQAKGIDWKVEGEFGNGGWKVKASVGGKC